MVIHTTRKAGAMRRTPTKEQQQKEEDLRRELEALETRIADDKKRVSYMFGKHPMEWKRQILKYPLGAIHDRKAGI